MTIRNICFFIILFLTSYGLHGQTLDTLDLHNIDGRQDFGVTKGFEGTPIFIFKIDNKTFQVPEKENLNDSTEFENIINKINPDWIESITIITKDEEVQKYGFEKKGKVVIVQFKEDAFTMIPTELRTKFKEE